MMYTSAKRLRENPPEKRVTHDKLPILRERLSAAIARLRSWDVRVADVGRLRHAEQVLRTATERSGYPTDPNQLRQIAEAIRIALDFGQIVDALGDTITQRLARELQRALKGSLEGTDRTRGPFQFQTQYWFGAALARGGLDPTVPSDRVKNPDFVVRPATLAYGVEVKRPERRRGALDSLGAACEQLAAADLHGIIVIDLSDCLEDFGLRRIVDSATDNSLTALQHEHAEFVRELVNVLWNADRREYRPGYHRVMGLWVLARGWRWVLDSPEAPQLFDFQGMQRLASAKGNVWFHLADEFFRKTLQGLQRGGFTVLGAEQESQEPILQPFWEELSL